MSQKDLFFYETATWGTLMPKRVEKFNVIQQLFGGVKIIVEQIS